MLRAGPLAWRISTARRDATKCMFGSKSLLPRNDTAITHFSALKRQGGALSLMATEFEHRRTAHRCVRLKEF
jgi:hypothetical protein